MADINRNMEIDISAKDQTKKGTDSATANLKAVAKQAGLVTAALGSALLLKSVQLWAVQEQAIIQVEKRLKSTGGVAGKTSKELQGMAAALQKVTIFGDETILQMQSLLLTFTGVQGQTFDRATKSILDMAAAMAASTGGTPDLRSAATMVGKALNDPILGISAMSRAGVQFNDAQKETIKTMVEMGNTAGAQAVILKELENQFGGASGPEGLAGAIRQAENAFFDMFEVLGEGATGASDLEGSIRSLTDLMADQSTLDAIRAMGEAFGFVATSAAMGLGSVSDLAKTVALAQEGDEGAKGKLGSSFLDALLFGAKVIPGVGAAATLASLVKDQVGDEQSFNDIVSDFDSKLSAASSNSILGSLLGISSPGAGGLGAGAGQGTIGRLALPTMPGELSNTGGGVTGAKMPGEANVGIFSSLLGGIGDLEQQLATRGELIDRELASRMALLQEAADFGISVTGLELRAAEDAARKKKALVTRTENDIKRIRMDALRSAGAFADNIFGAMANSAEAGSKKEFDANKNRATASAIVNTAQGATKAFSQWGWPWGALAAAAVVAAGLSQVSKIRSQTFEGGGGDTSIAFTPSVPLIDEGIAPVTQPQPVGTNVQQGPTYNIQVMGNIIDHDKFAQELITPLERARLDGVEAQVI